MLDDAAYFLFVGPDVTFDFDRAFIEEGCAGGAEDGSAVEMNSCDVFDV